MLAAEIPILRTAVQHQPHPVAPRDNSAATETARAALARAKQAVGTAKAKNMRRWHALVNSGGIMEARARRTAPVINRAFHKLHEIAVTCVLPPVTRSIHLCEAPGGFVQCTQRHLAEPGAWKWVGVSLQSDSGPRFATDELPMACGTVLHADVRAVADCVALCRSALPDADFVTADGATAMDHAALEEEHLPLLWAQTRVAVACLRPGGTFLVKFFEGFLGHTRGIVAYLATVFKTVSIIKPSGSRPTNSERYLLCRDRAAAPELADAYAHILVPGAWDAELQDIVVEMADAQTRCITRAVAQMRL